MHKLDQYDLNLYPSTVKHSRAQALRQPVRFRNHGLIKTIVIVFLALICLGLIEPEWCFYTTQDGQSQHLEGLPLNFLWATYVEGGSNIYIPPPRSALDPIAPLNSTIQVKYVGAWTPQARAAFEFAKRVWEANITSPVVIQVVAEWKPMGHPFILGGAAAADYFRDQNFPFPDTWYPAALANKLAGRDLNPGTPDIEASFNSNFTFLKGWYFGTDGKLSSQHFDFVSVVLHELGHGLGFAGSMTVSDNTGSWGYGSGYPFIYDRFVINNLSQSLIDINLFPNPSRPLAAQLTSNALFFNSSRAVIANGGNPPRLYAPPIWEQGSSFSHLDEGSYPIAAGNALMSPNLSNGEVVHNAGSIVLSMFEDMGWTTSLEAPTPTPTEYHNFFIYLPFIGRIEP